MKKILPPYLNRGLVKKFSYVYPLFCLLLASTLFQAHAQKINDRALDFAIFVKEDVTLKPNEVEGRVAAGGKLILDGNVQIIPQIGGGYHYGGIPIGLAIRGGVQLKSGSELKVNQNHYVKIGNSAGLSVTYEGNVVKIKQDGGGTIHINSRPGTPPVSEVNNPVFENVFGNGPGQIDIDGAFAEFSSTSTALSLLPNNVKVGDRDKPSVEPLDGPILTHLGFKPEFRLDPNGINVITIDALVWGSLEDPLFTGLSTNPGFALIINIVNANNKSFEFRNNNLQNGTTKQHVVYNFPDVTDDVNIWGYIYGLVFAPNGKVIKKPNHNLVGQVIARAYEHNGDEMHFHPLIPEIFPKTIDLNAWAECYLDAPYLNYSITGNYDMTGEKAKIEWLTPDGTVVCLLNNQPLSGQLLFPGADVDENGNGIAWPGWVYQNGNWVEISDLNAELKKPGAKIRVTVGTTAVAEYTYPPSTEDCYTSPPPGIPPTLPVRLISFNVEEAEQQTVAVRWEADNAKDFSHFEVERSTDGRNFRKIGTVTYVESSSQYRFIDQPSVASTLYYRLKMIDNDGSFNYSPTEVLVLSRNPALVAYGYPNPFANKLYVFSPSKQNAVIYDITGRAIERLSLEAGKNEVNAQPWPNGIYLIRTDDSQTVKLVKQ